MATSRNPEQVDTHLRQIHAAELAQLGELRILRDECSIPGISALLDQHLAETSAQVERLEARIAERGGSTSLRLVAQTLGGAALKGVVDRFRSDDPAAILRDAVAAEAGEIVSYWLLELEALHAGDESTAVLAQELRLEETAARDALLRFWHQVVHRKLEDHPLGAHAARTALLDHLRDVHVLERNATLMLGTVLATVQDELVLARVRDHQRASQRHAERVALRLRELGSAPSPRRLAQGVLFAAAKTPINLLRAERAAKDARDMYVVEHLELAAYGELEALAEAAGDERTAQLAVDHAAEERAMVDWIERDLAHFLLETLGRPSYDSSGTAGPR